MKAQKQEKIDSNENEITGGVFVSRHCFFFSFSFFFSYKLNSNSLNASNKNNNLKKKKKQMILIFIHCAHMPGLLN